MYRRPLMAQDLPLLVEEIVGVVVVEMVVVLVELYKMSASVV